jgi:hypothetical protein
MEKPVAEECFCVNGFSAQKACPQFARTEKLKARLAAIIAAGRSRP